MAELNFLREMLPLLEAGINPHFDPLPFHVKCTPLHSQLKFNTHFLLKWETQNWFSGLKACIS